MEFNQPYVLEEYIASGQLSVSYSWEQSKNVLEGGLIR
jgi:hypothetical protein